MNISNAVPKIASGTFRDMISPEVSPEIRCAAARRYAEIIIDIFFSKDLKASIGEEKFYKLSLGERIKGISDYTTKEIIEILYRIKDYGDKSIHYNPSIRITSEDSEKIANEALGIYEWILIDYFRKNRFDKTENTSTIFSALFPELRANVLEKFVEKKYLLSQYDKEIFHKYILALVKANKVTKAKRVLEDFKKKGYLGLWSYMDGKDIINKFGSAAKCKGLPIPVDITDCKRNFEMILKDIDHKEKNEMAELIEIIEKLLENYEASDMGRLIPNKVYRSIIVLESV